MLKLWWRPSIFLQCKLCKDILFSEYEGQYKNCSCGKVGIDETTFYCRTIGERKNYRQKRLLSKIHSDLYYFFERELLREDEAL